jgi:hypothetical protein
VISGVNLQRKVVDERPHWSVFRTQSRPLRAQRILELPDLLRQRGLGDMQRLAAREIA